MSSLIERKLQWAKREQDRLIALQQEKVPKGQTLLPDPERIRTLNALKTKREDLVRQIQLMPLVIELNSLKKRKSDMEQQLLETENGIQLFSRSKVYVPTEDFEKMKLNEAA
ncbi:Enkurin domain-containing protein 1 [Kappamyces sp. JEL0829]|nr:Enkurin domain-containing protein 1 [Kappamyces sp. JEL0829]